MDLAASQLSPDHINGINDYFSDELGDNGEDDLNYSAIYTERLPILSSEKSSQDRTSWNYFRFEFLYIEDVG